MVALIGVDLGIDRRHDLTLRRFFREAETIRLPAAAAKAGLQSMLNPKGRAA
jgi:hypothetical protein